MDEFRSDDELATTVARGVALRALSRITQSSGELAAELDALAGPLHGEPLTKDTRPEQAKLESPDSAETRFERLDGRARQMGWWLGVLSSALGAEGIEARRERRGLAGAERLVGSGADLRLIGSGLPDLRPGGAEDGWTLPFAWLWFLDAVVAGGGDQAEVVRSGDQLALQAGPDTDCSALASWLEGRVPGAGCEIAPGSFARLEFGDELIRWQDGC